MGMLLTLQIVFISTILILNIIFLFLPLYFFTPVRLQSSKNGRSQLVMDLSGSLSAGVYLGTCFVQLIPYVEDKFFMALGRAGLDTELSAVTTQCLVMAGFFMIILVEQLVQHCQQRSKQPAGYESVPLGSLDPLPGSSAVATGYEASSDSSSSESETDDPRRAMLAKPRATSTMATGTGILVTSSAGKLAHGEGTAAVETSQNGSIPSSAADLDAPGNGCYDSGELGRGRSGSAGGAGLRGSDCCHVEAGQTNTQVHTYHSFTSGGHSHKSHGGHDGHGSHSHGQGSHGQGGHSGHGHGGHSGGHGHGGHGHTHLVDVALETHGLRCVLLLAALSVHSLFEGVALGLQDSLPHLVNLFIGVAVHESLVALALGLSLARQALRLRVSVQLGVLFSAMIPLGMMVGMLLGDIHGVGAELTSASLQALAAGTFVYVVFIEVLPVEVNALNAKFARTLFMVIGFVLIVCLRLGMSDHD